MTTQLTLLQKVIFLLIGLCLVTGFWFALYLHQSALHLRQDGTLTLNQTTLQVEEVRTSAEQERGLGFLPTITENEGMLFVYSQPVVPTFWMKHMRFSIDLIWLKDNRIIGLEQNLAVDDGRRLYQPNESVDAVLELKAGWTERHGTKMNDRVTPETTTQNLVH